MTSRLFTVIRLLLLPVLIGAGFIVYGHCMTFISDIFPMPVERGLLTFGTQMEKSLIIGRLLTPGFLSAAVISILFCYPMAFLYKKSSVTVALLMTLPVLFLRMPELTAFDRHPIALAISVYEVLAYALLLVVGTWLAYSHLARSNPSFKRTAAPKSE